MRRKTTKLLSAIVLRCGLRFGYPAARKAGVSMSGSDVQRYWESIQHIDSLQWGRGHRDAAMACSCSHQVGRCHEFWAQGLRQVVAVSCCAVVAASATVEQYKVELTFERCDQRGGRSIVVFELVSKR